MPEVRDPAIKLFGMTIPLPPITTQVGDDEMKIHKPSESSEHSKSIEKESSSLPTAEDSPATPCENPKTPSSDKENSSPQTTKNEEQSEMSNSEEKTLKKPDKIVPCPRCSSMDTKFCYYNNYNVNQPRHFCKNCQRYWTAGGTMRNVPVGSGRRKNKSSSSSHYPHPSLKTNGTVLAFGSDGNIHDSKKNADDYSSNSSENVPHGSFHHPQVPWPMNAVQWGTVPPMPQVSFYPPPPYWGCAWNMNMPWISPPQQPNSPTLGKHSRDGEKEEASKSKDSEGRLWVPKTLRIDDPNEAARSSIWSTLGIKNEKGNSINEGGLFKAFQSKCDEKALGAQSSLVRHANPAALSRSLNFHETTE